VTKRDTVLVALSGHGLQPEGTKGSYFCPSDANPTKPATLLPLTGTDGLVEQLADSGVGVKLLLVDACRNNPADKGMKGLAGDRVETLPRGMTALFSCSPGSVPSRRTRRAAATASSSTSCSKGCAARPARTPAK
jgi:uncharacterized caspase-like protein